MLPLTRANLRLPALAFAIVAVTCSRSDSESATQKKAPPNSPTAVNTGTPRALTAEELRAFERFIKSGELKAREGFWAEASDEFEAALKIKRSDSEALRKLGFALFQAGDYPEARVALSTALSGAADTVNRAKVLYLLGRVEESMQNFDEAKRLYDQSLQLKASETVRAQRAKVGKRLRPTALRVASPCRTGSSVAVICKCLLGTEPEEDLQAQSTCEPVPQARVEGFTIINVADPLGGHRYYLIYQGSRSRVEIVADLGEFFEGGIGNVENLWTFDTVQARDLGEGKILFIQYTVKGTDVDYGEDEQSTYQLTTVTLCVLRAPNVEKPRCVLQVPTFSSFARSTLTEEEDSYLEPEERRKLSHPSLRKEQSAIEIELSPKGTALVKLTRGKIPKGAKSQLGLHWLWR